MVLWQGDCLERMKNIPDGSIDMVLCDLPYGITQAHWDKPIPLEPLWEEYTRVIKANGAIVLFSQLPFTADLVNAKRKWFRYEIVWEKTCALGFLNAKRMPLRAHENILVFYAKLPTYNPQMTKGEPGTRKHKSANNTNLYNYFESSTWVSDGTRYPRDVIKFSNFNGAGKDAAHSSHKPVPLLEYLIRTYTNEGETVLDNCMGSGSTGVACINTGRNFVGIELDETYFQMAEERLAYAKV